MNTPRLFAVTALLLLMLLAKAPAGAQLLNSPYDGKLYVAGTAQWLFNDEYDIEEAIVGGGGDPAFDFDSTVAGSAALGVHLLGFRVEGEVSAWNTDADFAAVAANGEVDNLSLMLNGYYDLPVFADIVDLYLGAGVGVTRSDFDFDTLTISGGGTSTGGDEWVATVQGMVGLGFNIHEHVALTAGYRIRFLEEADFGGVTIEEDVIHSLEVGVRLRF